MLINMYLLPHGGVNMWHNVVEPRATIKAIGIPLDACMWQMTINKKFTHAILRLY